MKNLLRLALMNRRHMPLIGLIFLAISLLTVTSQMEIFCLGFVAQRGPNFFQLFGDVKGTELETVKEVRYETVEKRWQELDADKRGYVTVEDTQRYMTQFPNTDKIGKIINWIDGYVDVKRDVRHLALILFGVAFCKALMLFFHQFLTSLLSIRISRDLRQAYFEHIQKLPMVFYHTNDKGCISTRLAGDTVRIADSLTAMFTNYFQTPFAIVTSLAFCFYTSWKLSLVIFLGLPLIVFPILTIARKVKRIAREQQTLQERFASVLFDFIGGIQTIKVFAMEAFSLKKFSEHNRMIARLEKKNARYSHSARPIVHCIGILCLGTTMLIGLYALEMTLSEVLVFSGMLYMFYEPVKKFAEQNNTIQRGIVSAERLFDILAVKPEIEDLPNAVELTEFKESLTFENVWFRYGGEWVLKDLSFTIRRGETIAIVGPTGAGKSTITHLIPRLYDVQKGRILIDGRPIGEYTQASIKECVGVVPQRPFLFADTIATNIAYGRPYSREEIEAAAMGAQADEFIRRMPQGYDTYIGETGLSGGQQQRLAIARVLVKKAPILIMDEATSSLDSVNERKIRDALEPLKGKITQILVAHRLPAIEHADRILYLEEGRLVASGTRDELLKSCSGFRLMWETLYNQAKNTDGSSRRQEEIQGERGRDPSLGTQELVYG